MPRSDGFVKIILVALLVAIFVMQAAPVLLEAYQVGEISIQPESRLTKTAADITFSVDSACIVQFTVGALVSICKAWIEVDDDSLPPIVQDPEVSGSVAFTYSYLVQPGEHTVFFKILGGFVSGTSAYSSCRNGYLQALIFLPDTAKDAVADREVEPGEGVAPSIVSRGPYVAAPGATRLVDTAGRVIENSIEEDKIYLSELPPGTYFARSGERTITKVVKVE